LATFSAVCSRLAIDAWLIAGSVCQAGSQHWQLPYFETDISIPVNMIISCESYMSTGNCNKNLNQINTVVMIGDLN
jgi:hypothetical protein